MADYSLNEWWQMRHSPVDNPLPALQLGASIVQHRAQQDLQERELGNQIARTSLMRDEQMFKQNLMLKVDSGNAELARAAAGITDFSDQAQMKPIYDLGAKYGFLVGTKGWEGIIHTHEKAVDAKRMALNTESLIASRQDRSEYNNASLALKELLADHTIPLTDARVVQAQQREALALRQLQVQEGNLSLRTREVGLKEDRFNIAKWSPEDRIELKERTKVVHDDSTLTSAEKDQAIQEIRGEIEGNRLQREKLKKPKAERQGLQTPPAPAVTPPTPIAPAGKVRVIGPDGRAGFIPESQLEEALKAGYTKP